MEQTKTEEIFQEMVFADPIFINGVKKFPALVIFINDETDNSIDILINKTHKFRLISRHNKILEMMHDGFTFDIAKHLAKMSENEKYAIKNFKEEK